MDLEQRQIELEKEYSTQGIVDALAHWEKECAAGRMADTHIGRTLCVRMYRLVADELQMMCETGTRGVGGKYRSLIREVGYDKAAVIGIRTALNWFTVKLRSGRTAPIVQDFISDAGRLMNMEHMHTSLSTIAPGYMARVDEYMRDNGTRSASHRKRTLVASANRIEGITVDDVTWSVSEANGVGNLLLTALVNTGVVELNALPKSGGQVWVGMFPSEEISDKLKEMTHNLKAFLRTPPMLVQPKEHTRDTLFSGASYRTEEMSNNYGTVHTRARGVRDVNQWIRNNISDRVLSAANKAQSQPYRINSELIELLRDVYASGVYNGVAGIPSNTPITPPDYPMEDGWDKEDPECIEQHAMWKAKAREAYSAEIQRRGHVIQFSLINKYLRQFRDDVLYFPTYFDWRGRLYFRSSINPQGTDFVKAALQFANKKALGSRGVYWLKVHVATCYGFDKANFDTRAVWTDEHMPLIRDAVRDHVDSDFFRAADSHWCFYVAAKELVQALDSGNPEAWESGIAVAMDATCSGLQHLSAIMLDPIGGMFTNLLPNNGVEKEDIYAGVAAIAASNIRKDVENPEQALFWSTHGIPRSMAKRPVMTYVYGGTLQSCTEYVYLDMQERGLEPLENYSSFKLAAYASRHLRKGIEQTVPASAECMRFLRDVAGKMPITEPMRWITPAGFPVVQQYSAEESQRISLDALGIKVTMRRFDHTRMQRNKCVNGVSPNFTHSLDSSHLATVIDTFDGSILPIHDSFGTHPSDVDAMHAVLRNTFCDMYENSDPLGHLVQYAQQFIDEELELPKKGTLALSKVKDSTFFMC